MVANRPNQKATKTTASLDSQETTNGANSTTHNAQTQKITSVSLLSPIPSPQPHNHENNTTNFRILRLRNRFGLSDSHAALIAIHIWSNNHQ